MKKYYLALGFAALIVYLVSVFQTHTITATDILILSALNFMWAGFAEKAESKK